MIITELPFMELKAGNCYLRKLHQDDAPQIFEIFSNKDFNKFSGANIHNKIEDSLSFIKYMNKGPLSGSHIAWGISLSPKEKIIGFIGVLHIDQKHCFGSFASLLHQDHWNKGIITNAHKTIIKWAFENSLLHRLESQFYESHTAVESMLNKSGMVKEAIMRENFNIENKFLNSIVYSVTKTDYLKNKTFYCCD